mgnify:CR=1 FL=1
MTSKVTGKAPIGVARLAKRYGAPEIAIAFFIPLRHPA